jgi:hypothetical protein
MAIYGDFDARFRPRPAAWRVAIVSLAHFAIALLLTNALTAAAEVAFSRARNWPKLRATPWSTMTRISDPPPEIAAGVALAFVIIGAVVLFLWPTRNTLARRLFVSTFAQSMAAFGAALYALRHASLLSVIAILPALWLCATAETRAIGVLASVADLDTPLPRFTYWFARIVPSMSALAAIPIRRNAWLACGLAAVTLMMNLAKRPTRYEVVEEPELREAAAVMGVIAAAIIALSVLTSS